MVTLYEHKNYQGKSLSLNVGDVPELISRGWNDVVSSIRVNGHSVVLFEHINFQGKSICVDHDMPQMPFGWNDKVSSIQVHPEIAVCGW